MNDILNTIFIKRYFKKYPAFLPPKLTFYQNSYTWNDFVLMDPSQLLMIPSLLTIPNVLFSRAF